MTVTNLAEYRVRKVLEQTTKELLAGSEEARGFWQLFRGDMCALPRNPRPPSYEEYMRE